MSNPSHHDRVTNAIFKPLQPLDEFNQTLERNTHPPDWVNPAPSGRYQLVVLGAGTAGLVTAAGAAGLGARVALIERELMGGDCLNFGCVPSKAIISSARQAANLRTAAQFGVSADSASELNAVANPTVRFDEVMRRMRRLRAQISPMDSAQRFRKLGVDVFFGQGSFVDTSTIRVTGRNNAAVDLKFKKAVIATGARAVAPPIPGLESVPYLTNENLFSLTELPRRFGIIGAGPIGVEMAQAFARLGSSVFLFDQAGQILGREDSDAAAVVQNQMTQDGVQFVLQCRGLRVEPTAGSTIRVQGEQHGQPVDIHVDQLLVAVGRAPNVEGLGLERIGIRFDRNGIEVNDFLQTTQARIFAAGDVCFKFKFTHAADFQARIAIQNALFALGPFGRKRVSNLLIPWSTYTAPEIAHVGLSPAEAHQAGIEIDTYLQSMEHVDRAILEGKEAGFVKVHTRKGTDKIVGATIVADHAGDLISHITLAMNHKLGLSRIGATIHPYPTQAEAIRKLGDQFQRTRLTPLSWKILRLLMRFNVGS